VSTLRRVPAEETRPVVACAGTGLYVLDTDLRPCEDGQVGEVYIGGELADGYEGLPEGTASGFLADPFAGAPGARMHRTGDLGRRLPGGDVEVVGRSEDRLAGVSLGEVEQALLAVGGLTRCVVLPADDGVTAHVVAEPGWPVDPEELRAAAAGFGLACEPVRHQYFTMGPDGRVDRLALASHQPARTARTHEERVVAGIWAELLDVPDPPAEVSFFELGGHSMAVIQLAMRLQRAFGLDIPVPDLFEAPTIAAQAALVERLYEQRLAELG
jgi:acyl-CoA synthetase (AMP-forming)/AMP-acid ligase II